MTKFSHIFGKIWSYFYNHLLLTKIFIVGNLWVMSITFKNGKYYYQFMAYGVRKHGLCRGCKSETEAKEFESEVYKKVCLEHRGLVEKTDTITIKEMFDNFLQYSEANKKDYKNDVIRVNILKQYFDENKPISYISPAKIDEFRLNVVKDRKISLSTFNRYFIALSKAFNLIIIEKQLNIQNPCRFVKRSKENNSVIRYLTEDEEERLMNVIDKNIKPIIQCALLTGLRLSNCLNLRWESINFEYNYIEILKQENKGHKKIQLPLSKKFKNVLEEIGIKKEGYVFLNPHTKKPFVDIRKPFQNALEEAKIKNFRFHDLRHTVATRLVMNGTDLMTVKEVMAHSDLKTTQRYMHPTPENMKKAIDILDTF